MGGDGGSIPRRCEMVKEKKEPEPKNKDQDMVGKWQHCAMSGQALIKPIMSCQLGRLYNKEAVINHILDKKSKSHIKKLADVSELKLTVNPAFNGEIHADSYIDHYSAPYVCPIIGLEMSGRYRFMLNWSCKCVISERALVEVPSETCQNCGAALDKDDLIVLNGTPDDMSELVQRILRKKDKAKQEKKVRKHQAVSEGQCEDSEQCENEVGESKNKQKRPQIGDGLSNGQKKKIKLASDKTSVSSSKFEETSSYKKLFHKNGVKKDKAHWVTYNPYYN